jgi:hypothetical protein
VRDGGLVYCGGTAGRSAASKRGEFRFVGACHFFMAWFRATKMRFKTRLHVVEKHISSIYTFKINMIET